MHACTHARTHARSHAVQSAARAPSHRTPLAARRSATRVTLLCVSSPALRPPRRAPPQRSRAIAPVPPRARARARAHGDETRDETRDLLEVRGRARATDGRASEAARPAPCATTGASSCRRRNGMEWLGSRGGDVSAPSLAGRRHLAASWMPCTTRTLVPSHHVTSRQVTAGASLLVEGACCPARGEIVRASWLTRRCALPGLAWPVRAAGRRR